MKPVSLDAVTERGCHQQAFYSSSKHGWTTRPSLHGLSSRQSQALKSPQEAAAPEGTPRSGDPSGVLGSPQTRLLTSFFPLTLDPEELLPQVLLPPQLLLFLLLLHLHVLLVVQASLFFGLFHFLTMYCAQSIEQSQDLTRQKL